SIAGISLAALLSGCVGPGEHAAAPLNPGIANESASPVQVSVDNFTFKPEVVTVHAGATVVWTNRDDVPHTVKSADKSFTSPALDTDDTFTRLFATPGEYADVSSIQ